jgi:hypothetical protein
MMHWQQRGSSKRSRAAGGGGVRGLQQSMACCHMWNPAALLGSTQAFGTCRPADI